MRTDRSLWHEPGEVPSHVAGADAPGSERILLVEDEEVVRELAGEMLSLEGYDVVSFADPEEALEHAGCQRFDALVTDVVMPRMNGRALAARLRERWPHLPIVYTSGYPNDAALRDGELERGAVFLQKPFGASELNRAVRAVLVAATHPVG